MEEPEPEPESEPEPQWEIQEYSSSKGGHENTMMKWILNMGYGIGKKMAITGIAISAAPLVLPPLVVFSAMGVAFSIPSGFVFASYACTNKLMTTLLPLPPSPPVILEYYTDEDEDEMAENEGVECRLLELNDSGYGYRQTETIDRSGSNVVSEEIKDVETTEPVTVYSVDESGSNVVLEKVEDAETTEPVIVREIETRKLVKDGSKKDKPIGEMHHVVILSPGSEGNNFDAREVEEFDLVAKEVVGDIDQDGGNIDSDEKVMRASMGTQEETGSDIRDEGTEDTSSRTRKDHSKHANVDPRKIDDETGLVLFDDQNTSMNFEGLAARGEAKGIVDENVDVLGLPAFRRVPLDTDNAEVMSKTNTKMPSREDALNDKMIWEKIGGKGAIEHKGEEPLLNSRLDENKGEEPLLENRLGEDESTIREVTKDSLEDIVKGSTGLLENVRDKGRVNDNTTEDYFLDSSASNVVSEEVKDVETTEPVTVNEGNVEDNTVEDDYFLDESASNVVLEKVEDAETTEPVIVREIETQKLMKDESKNNKPIGEMHRVVILSPGNEGNNFNAREVEELDMVAREVVGDIDQDGGNIDSDEKVMRASMGTQEETGSDIRDEGTEDTSLQTRQDHSIHANVDTRKIDDETGLVLFDDQNTSMNFEGLAARGEGKGIVDENVDVLGLPAFRRVPLDTDNAEVTSKMPSREDALNDKMIWEKIGGKGAIEHMGEEPLLNSRLDENKGKEPLVENRLGEEKSKTREVTKESLEDIVKGSTGLLENLRDKGRVNDNTTEDYFLDRSSASNVVSEEVKDVETTEPVTVNEGSVEDNTVEDDYFLDESASNVVLEKVEDAETTEPVIVREIETQKLVKGESKNNKPIGEMHRVVILSPGSEGNNFDAREVEEFDLVAKEVVGDIDQDGGNIDSDEKVMRASMGTQEETGSDIRYEGTEDTSLRTRKDHLIHANVDAREMDGETGLDLFVDQNTSMNFEDLAAGGKAKGTVDENMLELPTFRQVPLDIDNAEVTSKTNTKTPSKEDALNDKMIWEKIGEKRATEHKGEESSLSSRLDENKGKGPLLESRLGEGKSKTQEVTKDTLEDIVKGSNGLLENVRDKGRVNDNTVEDDYFSVSDVVFEEVKEAETTEPVTVKGIETQILVKGGSKNKETIGEMHHAVLLSAVNERNNFNLRGVEELDRVSREVVVDFVKDGGDIDYDEKVMKEGMGTDEKTGSCISDQGTEDASLKTKKDHLIHANVDARKMGDESGLDLFDDQKTSMKFQSSKGGGASNEIVVDKNVDVLALPAFRRVSLDTDNGTVTSKMNAKTPSREDVLEDEKIWEKIVAMRTIVGYNAPSQPTCMGELKALYVFTGVEPPASFEGYTDLDEVNAKLKFLMAIVGVK